MPPKNSRSIQRRPQLLKELPKAIRDAIDTGRAWTPQSIGELVAFRTSELRKLIGVEDVLKGLRVYVKKLDTSDDRILADELLGLIRAVVDGLNWLADAGKLGDVPSRHETWPINYAPDASKGASKWKAAKELYQRSGCGKDAIIPRIAGQVSWENRWTKLAELGVRAAKLAKDKAAWVDEQTKDAKVVVRATTLHVRKKIEGDYYLCRDGKVIAWPLWAQQSRRLPEKLTSNTWKKFLPVVRELVRIYLIEDEKRMREYLKAALPEEERDDVKKWDADIFNNKLMDKVEGALKSLASR